MSKGKELVADYVIVGAGAVGMAFADAMLTHSDASMIIIDRRHKPGGLWNDAYSFVRLHGPAAYYGVNSEKLGSELVEEVGLNRGLYELASGPELAAYFDNVMRKRLLPSGRVTYLPLSEYKDGVVTSQASGETIRVRATKRLVDATYADTRQPNTHAPSFSVGDGVRCITPNVLPQHAEPDAPYVVIGAGKTAMDTVTWLLEKGVVPERITWVRPRDAWVLNRKNVQPMYNFFAQIFTARAIELEAARDATSIEDLFQRLEAGGILQRLDPEVTPTMFRCSICSEAEVAELRRVKNVVRMGHVRAILYDRLVMDTGVIGMAKNAIYINCSADGIPDRPSQPIYQKDKILLQYVRRCSPTFSGAFVAHLETMQLEDAARNAMCTPVPPPSVPLDWIRMQLQESGNQSAWAKTPGLQSWLLSSRLDRFSALIARAVEEQHSENLEVMARYRAAAKPGIARLAEFMESATRKQAA
jgi:hypothetical protein